jgi:taurine dioxygenase
VRTHPETGERALFVNAFATHLVNFHTPANMPLRPGLCAGAAQLLHYLISQAAIPEYQVRLALDAGQRGHLGQPLHPHYAVQDYWPAVRKMERAGIIGDRPFLTRPPHRLPKEQSDELPSTTSLFPETRRTW